ncbi:MAG: CopG family transcriptional regulator [Candidatus Kapabacteria bacterium]|nr:CopG family transcriptional regulator [Candidatus Kapabacteria bacterium]
MSKTITVRIEDKVYDLFKKAANSQNRSIPNYMEFATLNFILNESVVDDKEMNEILLHTDDLDKGLSDIAIGRYKIIG